MSGPLVVVGDAVLDVDVDGRVARLCPDAPVPVLDEMRERPRPGGAALAAAMAAADGHEVILVAPLRDDEDGRRLAALLEPAVSVVALPTRTATATKRRIRSGGQTLLRLDSGDRTAAVSGVTEAAVAALRRATTVLVSDYGRGATAAPAVRGLLTERAASVPVVWDPHPRGTAPVARTTLVTPNLGETESFARQHGLPAATDPSLTAVTRLAEGLVAAWGCRAVAVTLGSRGALLSYGAGTPALIPAPAVATGDPCGAGDRFAATATVALGSGLVLSEAVQAAVQSASAHVAGGGAAAFAAGPGREAGDAAPEPVTEMVAAVRGRGGVVVATGGCFDLLHAGHVATLRAARSLGDCLVVCLNSDDSVRRLKGPGRPLVPAADRARVLQELSCVDAVTVFAEDTPQEVLRRLRPQVWAKGGDYAGTELPEAVTLRSWGGQAVVLPYVAGRSTTSLVRSAATSAARPEASTTTMASRREIST